jgi:hypothetical protein
MELDRMLDRCRTLEERAAALYRGYAAATRHAPPLCALWTELAREEEEHARSLAVARRDLEPVEGWRTDIRGWEEALGEIEARLATAEGVGAGGNPDRQLAAALDLEMTELEALRRLLLLVSHRAVREGPQAGHAERLADAATRLSEDPHVTLQAALLRARARLQHGAG